MKATYLPLAAGLLAGCAQPAQQQAEAAANRYLRTTLHDPGSYELVRATSQPYRRQDSLAYAARLAAKRLGQPTDSLPTSRPPKPSPRDTVRLGWVVKLAYRIRNGYNAASNEEATFVVYSPDSVVPIDPQK